MIVLAMATALERATTFPGSWLHPTRPIANATCVLLNVSDEHLFDHFGRTRLRARPAPNSRKLDEAPLIMVVDAPVVRSGPYTRIRRYEGGYAWLPSWQIKPYADPYAHVRCVPAMISDGEAGIAMVGPHPTLRPPTLEPDDVHDPADRAHLTDPLPAHGPQPLLHGQIDGVRPLLGFGCREVAITASEALHDTKRVLERVRPAANAPVMGWLPGPAIVRDPIRVANGFAQIMNYDGTTGWARRSDLQAIPSPHHPNRCIPFLMTDNFAGFGLLEPGERL